MIETILSVIGALVVCILIFAGAVCWLQSEEEKYMDDKEENRRDDGGADL